MNTHRASWRLRAMGILRIIFGLVYAIDAYFKWQPAFGNNLTQYLTGNLDGQPSFVQVWIHLWINIAKVNPHVFANLVALGETAVAIGLIFGILSNLTNSVGVFFALIIWTTAEGFGGPYTAGATDIGTAIIYVLVLVGLFLSSAGLYYGVDRYLSPKLGRFSLLATGSPAKALPTSGVAPDVMKA